MGDYQIQAGCFFGSFATFCQRVKAEYSGTAADTYIAAAQQCVDELTAKLATNEAQS